MTRTIIKIQNPAAYAGKQYTSGKRALRLVRDGAAVFLDDGTLFVNPDFLVYLPACRRADYVPLEASGFEWRGKESGKTEHGTGCRVMQAERTLKR